jgi:signal transduction histidine kinase
MRIAYELIGNATKHGAPPVLVETSRLPELATLRVTDHGGFDPGPDIFEAFAQADMSSTREKGGLGLGLFITHRLCQGDGGRLSLRREGDLTVAEVSFLLG